MKCGVWVKPHQQEKKKIFRIFSIQNTVHGILNTVLATVLLVSCTTNKDAKSEKDKYEPLVHLSGGYGAQAAVGAAYMGTWAMMFAKPQAGSAQEKDQISGKCRIAAKTAKDANAVSELCNGIEVFLYTPDGRILQRTWAFDGAYRFKVATEGPYTIKAKHSGQDITATWEGARRGQQLNLDLEPIKK